jgi:parvulin-like peptidyl-prolyl isomerase
LKKLASILSITALALAACGGASSEVAATVNGTDVTVGDVEANIDPQEGTISKEMFAQFLGFEIQWVILDEAVDERFEGIEFTEEQVEAEADRIFEVANAAEETREEFLAARSITEEFLQTIAQQRLIDEAIRDQLSGEVEDPTQEDIDTAVEGARDELTSVCVSHILVGTQEEAQAVLDRLQAGEDFAQIAAEVSTDPGSAGSGGVLPCGSPSGYVPPFAEATLVAPIGEVYPEIVETEFGFHVVLVTERTIPTEGDLPTEEEIAESLSAQAIVAQLEEWFLQAVAEAEVTVNDRFGTWQTEPQPMVVPPAEE